MNEVTLQVIGLGIAMAILVIGGLVAFVRVVGGSGNE